MTSLARRIVTALGAALVGGGLVVAGVRHARSPRAPDLRFEATPATHADVVAKVTATGTVSALVTVQVGSQVSGRVAELFVDFNAPVKKGQLLAKLDTRLLEASLAQAKASVLAATGNLEKAKVQAADAERVLRRAAGMAEQGLGTEADREAAQSAVDAAKAGVTAARGALEQATANLEQARVNLAYATIVSPIDGVVISRSVDVGQTVAASLQAPTLFLIAQDLTKMQVDTSVAEGDVGKLKAGMTATFTVDAYPAKRFKGTIRQIRNAPQTVQNVVTYDAVIDVDNPDLELKPGMTANATVVYAERPNALVVPNAALRFRPPAELSAKLDASASPSGAVSGAPPEGGRRGRGDRGERGPSDRRAVWVLRGDVPERVRVRVGLSDGSVTEIVEGELADGDRIVTDATPTSEGGKPASGGPPGASPAGGGMRRIF